MKVGSRHTIPSPDFAFDTLHAHLTAHFLGLSPPAKELQSAQPVDQVLPQTEVSVSGSDVPASPQNQLLFHRGRAAVRGRRHNHDALQDRDVMIPRNFLACRALTTPSTMRFYSRIYQEITYTVKLNSATRKTATCCQIQSVPKVFEHYAWRFSTTLKKWVI